MKKIAFLFLTMDNPNFPKLWDKYFKGHEDKYNIYIHPKYPEKVTWRKKNIIKNLKETGWGFITQAYIELMKEAINHDLDNYKFITISESCVPIKTFEQFYEAVISDPRSWVKKMHIQRYDQEARINKTKLEIKNNNIIPKFFLKHYARFCLNKDDVILLLLKSIELKFFHNMHVGDEFFLTVLYPLNNIKDYLVTYDDWDYINLKKMEIKNKIKEFYEVQEKNGIDKSLEIAKQKELFGNISKNPKTIFDVKEDLEKIKECKSFFYRKFDKTSNIEKYWNEIIKHAMKSNFTITNSIVKGYNNKKTFDSLDTSIIKKFNK